MESTLRLRAAVALAARALAVSFAGIVGTAPRAEAASESCTFNFNVLSNGSEAFNFGGSPYGKCATVQARTYYYYGAGVYGWVTGQPSDSWSSATNGSYNSIQNRQARVKPTTIWSTYCSYTASGLYSRTINT